MESAALFRLLGDDARLRILRLLEAERLNVTELTAILGIAQSGVSRHLGLLKDAGLVEERRDGRFARYRVRAAGLKPLVDWIEHYRAFWRDRLPRLKALVEEMNDE